MTEARTQLDVLIVDDNPAIRTSFASILRSAGHRVEGVPNGQAALERLRQIECTVLMADVEMPGMSGLELLSLLPENKPLVILVTAAELAPELVHSPSRVFGTLRKPVPPPHLRSLVAEAIDSAWRWP